MELNKEILKEQESYTFKIIIPEDVERIIRHLCNKVHDVEWSGILFYTYEGTWEDNNLNIICEDILPMDIGTSTYTDFTMSPEVIAYMTEHNLLDCECGLIHSHNNMKAFFSSTDINTLRDEGNDRNHFVSLIVNNEGEYVAAITRKIKVHEDIVEKSVYNTFNNEERQIESDKECEREYCRVQYTMLEVVKEGWHAFDELDERLDSIKKAKEEAKFKAAASNFSSVPSFPRKESNVYSPSLFDDYDYYTHWNIENDFFKGKRVESSSEPKIPEDVVKLTAARLLTCSMTLTGAYKFDFRSWISKMDSLCEKAFADERAYEYFIDIFTEYVIYETAPIDLCEKYDTLPERLGEVLLEEVIDFLSKLPTCKYSEILLNHLIALNSDGF